jgi:hypothetical protein
MQILPGWWKAYSVTTWVSAFFVAIVLIVGGVQLLRKRSYARWLIVGASGIVIAIELVAIVILADLGDRIAKGVKGAKGASSVMVSQITGMGTAVLLVLMIFPIVTILLTLLPPTKRWCLQRAD